MNNTHPYSSTLIDEVVHATRDDQLKPDLLAIDKEKAALFERIQKARHFDEVETILHDHEDSLRFQTEWASSVLLNTESYQEAITRLKIARRLLSELETAKSIYDLNLLLQKEGVKQTTQSEQSPWHVNSRSALDNVYESAFQQHKAISQGNIIGMRKLLQCYRFRHHTRAIARYGLRMFWGLLIFTLLVNFIVDGLLAHTIAVFLVAVGIWFLQHHFFDRWVDAVIASRLRNDIKASAVDLFDALSLARIRLSLVHYEVRDITSANGA